MNQVNFLSIALLIAFLFNSGFVDNKSHPLHGMVLNKETGKPRAGVYLYIVQGEEEGLTNANGEFRFKTWQQFPVTIYLRNGEKDDVAVRITDPSKKITVKL